MAKKSKKLESGETFEEVAANFVKTAVEVSENGEVDAFDIPTTTGDTTETETIDADEKGNRFLPGQEVPVAVEIKPLIMQARHVETVLKKDFAAARDALVSGQTELARLAHANIEHFSEPDENGKRVYKFGTVTIEITFEKEKIKAKIDEEE